MKKNTTFSNQKFEFLLKINNNIICQRYFNVKDYNPKARRSMDMHEYVKNICSEIERVIISTYIFSFGCSLL
jgi:hypothetical protein